VRRSHAGKLPRWEGGGSVKICGKIKLLDPEQSAYKGSVAQTEFKTTDYGQYGSRFVV